MLRLCLHLFLAGPNLRTRFSQVVLALLGQAPNHISAANVTTAALQCACIGAPQARLSFVVNHYNLFFSRGAPDTRCTERRSAHWISVNIAACHFIEVDGLFSIGVGCATQIDEMFGSPIHWWLCHSFDRVSQIFRAFCRTFSRKHAIGNALWSHLRSFVGSANAHSCVALHGLRTQQGIVALSSVS